MRESHLLSGYCLVTCIKSQSKTDNQAPPTGRQHLNNYDVVTRISTTEKQSNIKIQMNNTKINYSSHS